MLTLNEVESVFPSLRDAALMLLLQNPGWTPREFRQYRKIDRALSDALYTVYAEMYTARWFNYPAICPVERGNAGQIRKAGIMDGSLTPTGRLVANKAVSSILLPGPYTYTSSPSLVITRQHYYNILFKFGEKKESEYAPGMSVSVVRAKPKADQRKERPVCSALANHELRPSASCFCKYCKDHRAVASRLNQLGLGEQPNVPTAQACKLGGAGSDRANVGSTPDRQPRTWTDVGVLVNGKRFDRPVVQGAGKPQSDARTELDNDDPVALLKRSMALTKRAMEIIQRALDEGDWG